MHDLSPHDLYKKSILSSRSQFFHLLHLQKEGVFAKLYPYYFTTVGTNASIHAMQKNGREMAQELKENGVDAVILVST